MTKKFEYKTILIKGRQNGIFAEFPFNVFKEFGTRKAIPVKAIFDGVEYNMSLLPVAGGTHCLHLRKEIRQKIGKDEGDEVNVQVEKDDSPKIIEIPEYLQWLFENEPEIKRKFNMLSNYYKKYWISSIEEPKKEEVKVERINRFFEFLREQKSK